MAQVNNSALRAALLNNIEDHNTLFGLSLGTMDEVNADFTPLGIVDKVSLKRKTIGNISMPALKNSAVNFTSNLLTVNERIGTLEDCKFDLKFDEAELNALNESWMGPANGADIHSLAGQEMIMSAIYERVADEIAAGVFTGVRGGSSVTNGGTNLFDGIWAKLLAAIVDTSFSTANNTIYPTSGAPTLTQANILAELKTYRDKFYAAANADFLRSLRREGGVTFMQPSLFNMLADAQDALLSNKDQIVTLGTDGFYRFKALPKVIIKPSDMMIGVNNFFTSLPGNLFFLYGKGNSMPNIKIQEVYRDLVFLGDYKAAVDFADPRALLFYKGY